MVKEDTRTLAKYTKKLIADPASLSQDDISEAMDIILHSPAVPEVQIAAFLVGCRVADRDHQPDFLAATVAKLAKEADAFDHVDVKEKFCDIVGTGGDGRNTFNVSTTSAIVAAGAGLKVAKHGGPASTSASGASDLLKALDIDLAKVTGKTVTGLLNQNDFVYMSGPVFHPILKRVAPLRKSLGVPTVFNVVGPLLNPAPIRARILGVYRQELGPVYAETARQLYPGTDALVVWGCEGLDELSIAGPTKVWKLSSSDGSISEFTLTPEDFGVRTHPLEQVASGTPAENAAVVRKLVNNELPEHDPILDYVLINTGALLVVGGLAKTWKEGAELARSSIQSGKAKEALERFSASTQAL